MSTSLHVSVDPWNPDWTVIARGAAILKRGGLVAFPTETVYGLGANGLDPLASRKIFEAKGRPPDNPLILHFANPRDVETVAFITERAERLMRLLWPGPLTLVLPSRDRVPHTVTAGLGTVAVRMPSHPVALALIDACGVPIAAPSANSSGRPSPTDARAVAADLKDKVDLILDSGPTSIGVESTVLDITGPKMILLRPGGYPTETIEEASGEEVLLSGGEAMRSPGTRYRHYAPLLPLLLDNEEGLRHRALSFGGRVGWMGMTGPERYFTSGEVGEGASILFDSMENYARGLFHALRTLEAREEIDVIVAQWPTSPKGLGRAVQDRLARAAGAQGERKTR